MMTARATPNIALIKYWGNRNDDLRLPAADSLSMTLDQPSVEISIEPAETLSVRSDRPLSERNTARFAKVVDLARTWIRDIAGDDVLPPGLAVTVDSKIPAGIGLASSAAVFAAFAKAIAELIRPAMSLDDRQTSILARLGSGSASRSIFGGFAAFINDPRGDRSSASGPSGIASAYAVPIADERHWPLRDIVIAPSTEHKKVGSTEGHAKAHTSPLFADRVAAIPRRVKECRDAVLDRDFEKLRAVAEEDALDMHAVMRSQDPPLQYLNAETWRIVDEIKELRKREHLPVLFTMDAGPTVHLLCEASAADRMRAYAREQKDCTVFESACGGGAVIA